MFDLLLFLFVAIEVVIYPTWRHYLIAILVVLAFSIFMIVYVCPRFPRFLQSDVSIYVFKYLVETYKFV